MIVKQIDLNEDTIIEIIKDASSHYAIARNPPYKEYIMKPIEDLSIETFSDLINAKDKIQNYTIVRITEEENAIVRKRRNDRDS